MKITSLFLLAAAGFLSAALFVEPASAQISIGSLTGNQYSQTFDSLASSGSPTWTDNSTLPGWYAAKKNTGTPSSFTAYTAGTGSSTAGALYSFGASGSSERALGSLSSGNASIGDLAYGVRFANDTALDITSITITYTGEQWRNGGNASAQTLAFSYRVSATPIIDPDAANTGSWTAFTSLDFTTPTVGTTAGALDGNASANRVVFSAIPLTGVVVPAGSEIFLRWRDINDTGNDHAVAIDDLTVNFSGGTLVTNAPTFASVTPLAQTNKAGTTASLTVANDGSPVISLSYQWRKDRIPLSDTSNISGSTTPTLTLTNLLAADAGSYDVVVANTAGSVTSAVATVTVIDPAIVFQSANQTHLTGESISLNVGAAGTPTLTYQWFLGSSPISGETASSLAFASVQATNQGSYTCRVTNSLGASVTSAPIALTVITTPSVQLARWDFNDTNAPLTSPPPVVGAGTAGLLNGVTATFAGGAPADPGGTNRGWNIASYPPQGTSNKLSGAQFSVSTAGYKNLLIAWQERHSNTASKYQRFQYSLNGTDFIDKDVLAYTVTDNSFVLYVVDLSAVAGVTDNSQFACRMVTEWESTAIGGANNNYVATTSYSSGASGGTIRFDLMGVYGDPAGAPSLASTTISNIIGTTLTYGGGSGSRFILVQSADVTTQLGSWAHVATNTTTPGSFTIPAVGSASPKFYRVKSE